MDSHPTDCEDAIDDEIYFGKLSKREMMRHIMLDRQTIACPYPKNEENDKSVRIIETNSEPNLSMNYDTMDFQSGSQRKSDIENVSINESFESYADAVNASDESFINMEKFTSRMSFLSKPSAEMDSRVVQIDEGYDDNNFCHEYDFHRFHISLERDYNTPMKPILSPKNTPATVTPCYQVIDPELYMNEQFETPLATQADTKTEFQPLQSLKNPIQKNLFITKIESHTLPNSVDSQSLISNKTTQANQNSGQESVFKTPSKPLNIKKANNFGVIKKTPIKINNYQYIASPIAAYIKNSPQCPLMKDVKPKKQLAGVSAIPKLIKDTPQTVKQYNKENIGKVKQYNKENINLPQVAYRSAKETKVVNLKNEPRLPQSDRIKKLVSSVPRPVVMKHDHRENSTTVKPVRGPEDSYADLSLHQADLSVCVQKPALSPRHHKLNTKK